VAKISENGNEFIGLVEKHVGTYRIKILRKRRQDVIYRLWGS
jgi:hypothetical protein